MRFYRNRFCSKSAFVDFEQNLQKALFTFSVGISVRREASDATADDEGIALAIAEETDAADERLAANRKLTEKVNKALQNMNLRL